MRDAFKTENKSCIHLNLNVKASSEVQACPELEQVEGEIPNLEGNQGSGMFLTSSENMGWILGKGGIILKLRVTK